MRSPRPLALALALAAAASALAGCATAPKAPATQLVWPDPPDLPRIRFVRAFQTEEDVGGGMMRSLGRAFLPTDDAVAVSQPTGLALSPDERTLYVTCNAPRRILAVNLERNQMRPVAQTGDDRPAGPFGAATDAQGNLFVTDHVGDGVFVFSPEGKFLRKFGKAQAQRPTGIAIDRRRQLVYVTAGAAADSKHHRVEVFSLQGEHLRTIGTRGSDPGQFNFPANLAVNRDGQLYVVDMLNFRMQVFDPEGQLVAMFGQVGAGVAGTFDKAKSVGFDGFGNVYVVDSQQAFVQLFNPKHQPLMYFGGRGEELGYMHVPTAIAISSTNRIFVADFAVDRVSEYELINTRAEDSYVPSDAPAAPKDGAAEIRRVPAAPGAAQPAATKP